MRRPGLAHGRGADARLHERRGARAHARDRRAALLQPLARASCGTRARPAATRRRSRAALRLRRRRAARARRARRARPATPASAPASTAATSSPPAPARGAARRSSARSPSAPPSGPTAPTPSRCSTTRRGSARRCRRRPRRSPAPRARRPTSASPRRPPTCSTTSPCCCAVARPRAGRRRGGAQWPSPLTASAARVSAVARRGARARARAQPDPAAPHLHRRLRDAGLRVPEAARRRAGVPARVRRAGPARRALLVHRLPPARGPALVAGRRRRPLRARRRARSARYRQAPLRGPAAVRRRRGRASSATTSCARSSRWASPTRTRSACPTWR